MGKDRSPTYPQLSIDQALERARQIYEHARIHAVPPIEVHKAWGYSSPNGPGLVAISTLKEFALLDDNGRGADRTLQLSKLAIKILRDEQEVSVDRNNAIREAASNPKIYKQLLEKYNNELPPGKGVIETELKINLGFSDKAAPKVVEKLRDTLAYCESLDHVSVGADTADDLTDAEFEELPPEADQVDTDQRTEGPRAQFNLSLRDGGRAAFAISTNDDISADEAALIMANVKHALSQCGAPLKEGNGVRSIED